MTSSQSHHGVGRKSPFQSRAYHSGCSATSTLSHDVWLATQSRMTFIPKACAAATKERRSRSEPNSGLTAR